MTLELISALSSLATLAVLLSGAVAAIVQFRHVRTANELAAVLAVERTFADPDLQSALLYVQNELPARLQQAGYRSALAVSGYIDPRAHPEMAVCNWFNEIGTMVAGGFLNEDVFFGSFGRLVEYYWRLLNPALALLRRERPDQYANFEFLAARAERWHARHGEGYYPAGYARLPVADPWAGIDRILAGDPA